MHTFYSHIPEFFTLLTLEMILGVDNLIFISLICNKLPNNIRNKTRISGIALALVMRFLMLCGASSILSMHRAVIPLLDVSPRNLFMIAGGGFLLYKSTKETFSEIFPLKEETTVRTFPDMFWSILQIIGIDLMLSLDSVISAFGITSSVLMICVVFTIYAAVAMLLSKDLGNVIQKYAGFKIIALLFIGVLGAVLFMDGLGVKVNHNYLYIALLFSITVETLNCLHKKYHNKKL
ncbi:TerC family protein [Anaplasma platys]|uniref:TerC family protein n=1 Tax=Anaplasma platys TaxID=949 RepID=A0A858PY10_9RICK|nr:TerC family protein [Anaplasma platys]QJC27475.1 TerC family protein [Anaplasma platys]